MSATAWNLDKAHSAIQFKAKHLMITTVAGTFTDYDASVETEGDDFSKLKVNFAAQTASVTTGNEQRDGHLKSDDFFNPEQFPTLQFVSTGVENLDSDGSFDLVGNLTIRDVTKPVKLKVDFNGKVKDPWGNEKLGFNFSSKVNRKDFGLKFHVVTEAGDLLVSDDIKIEGEVQLVKA